MAAGDSREYCSVTGRTEGINSPGDVDSTLALEVLHQHKEKRKQQKLLKKFDRFVYAVGRARISVVAVDDGDGDGDDGLPSRHRTRGTTLGLCQKRLHGQHQPATAHCCAHSPTLMHPRSKSSMLLWNTSPVQTGSKERGRLVSKKAKDAMVRAGFGPGLAVKAFRGFPPNLRQYPSLRRALVLRRQITSTLELDAGEPEEHGACKRRIVPLARRTAPLSTELCPSHLSTQDAPSSKSDVDEQGDPGRYDELGAHIPQPHVPNSIDTAVLEDTTRRLWCTLVCR